MCIDGEKKVAVVDKVLVFMIDLKKQTPPVQMGVGAGFGTVTGYFLTKGGRVVAATVGISFLLAQYGIHKGYITLNESKIKRDLNKLKKQVSDRASNLPVLSTFTEDTFFYDNRWIFGGFAAGMLIGFSLA
ncbi:unnamed protein product [Caenorhabditis angaria]|uniref:FUN14 domain-containing protein 1 n=1 Tax=Caenorhabditis angaria TaxID=860376 RepID=A0A9P1IIE6_9PELO|nr:unnamed protein product [Caenorhabditis angaria]